MPRKRRPQSPAEAAEIPNLPKRQKSEQESETKTLVKPRLVSSEATPRLPLTKEEWRLRSPLPTSMLPSHFLASSRFRRQTVKKLKVEKRLAAKSRPPFARLLCIEKLQEDDKLLAAYLGFNTAQQLYYFVHFDVPNTLNHVLRIHYPDYRDREQQSASYTEVSGSFPPASRVWERFWILLQGNLNWLELALDTSRPDQVLVSSIPFQQKLVGDEQNITLKDIDPTLSILAASYKLAKAHPNRFCQQQPQKPIEYVWGLHHEDWMRAYAVITFACDKHLRLASGIETKTNLGFFGPFTALRGQTQKSESFGYVTDVLLAQVKTLDGPDRMTATQQERGVTEMKNLSQLATKDDIEDTINSLELFQSKTAAERDCLIQDSGGALSEIIIEAVCTTLRTVAPGIDLEKRLKTLGVSIKRQRSAIEESEREVLRALLKSRVTANEHMSFSSNIDLERMRKARMHSGEKLLPNQDFSSIYSLKDIDVNTLSAVPYNSPIEARAPHILDANRLAALLGGPLRTAILHNECGTGNISVALLASKLLIDERIYAFGNGLLHMEESDRIFKPSIVFVRSETLRSHFTSMRSCWMGIFHISLLCDASESWMNPDGKFNVIDSTAELQKHIDRWAAEHRDPRTAQTILLASYEAGTKLMHGQKTSQSQSSQRMPGAVAQKDTNVVLGDVAPKDDDEDKSILDGIDLPHLSSSEKNASAQSNHERMVIHSDMWNMVVLDECHFISDETTSYHRLVKQLDRDALLLVSSTPLTILKDLYSYLGLMWNTAWSFSYSMNSDSTIKRAIYDPETYEHLLSRDITHEAIRKRVIAGGIASDTLTPRQRQRRAEYIKFILEGSGPAYLLHPELYKDFWQTNGLDASAMAPVFQKLSEMVSVRRSLLTPLRLPNNDITYFGMGGSGLSIQTVELTSTDSDSVRKRVKSHISELLKCSEDLNVEIGEVEATLDSAVCRRLSMISTDVNNIALTTPTNGLIRLISTPQGSPIYFYPLPMEGSDYINWLTKWDTTGGLEWLFYHTRKLQRYSFPKDSLGQVRYTAWDSPKYCHVLLRALEAKEQNEKLLVCVNNPLTSQIINALLVACGIKTIHCTSRLSEPERRQAIEAFNHWQSTHTCLVVSLQLCASGPELYESCHKGVIMELPTNHSLLLDTIGRLWRVNQKPRVEWEILIAKHTFDAFIEGSIMKEYSAVVAVTANITSIISGEARMICAYEIVRQQFGQEYSLYPRMRAPWNEMDGDDMRREGYFYSELAQFFFQSPDQAFLVGRYNIRQIALAWKMGMKITIDMVKQPAALEAGEGLVLQYL